MADNLQDVSNIMDAAAEIPAQAEDVVEDTSVELEPDSPEESVADFDPDDIMEELTKRAREDYEDSPTQVPNLSDVQEPEAEAASDGTSEIEALRAELEAAKKALEEAKEQEKEEDEPLSDPIPQKDGVWDFVGEEEVTDLVTTKEGLNKLLTRAVRAATELSMRYSVPIVTAEAARVNAIHAFATEFYRAHPELREHAKKVSDICTRLTKEDPNLQPKDLFVKIADTAYAELGIVPKRRSTSAPSPAATLAGPRGAAAVQSGGRTLRDQLSDLM